MQYINIHQLKAAGKTLETVFHFQYKNSVCYLSKLPPKSADYNIIHYKDKVKKLDVSARNDFKLFTGHQFFGLHTYLDQPAKYITILRNPENRLVSYYYYLKKYPELSVGAYINKKKISLCDFLSLSSNEISTLPISDHHRFELNYMLENGQAKFIAGVYENCSNILTLAERNLDEHFVLCGVTEKFNETIALMSKMLNWKKPVFFASTNITKKPDIQEPQQKEYSQIIQERNSQDIELYEKMGNRFKSSCEQHKSFIDRFNKKTRIYGKLFGLYVTYFK